MASHSIPPPSTPVGAGLPRISRVRASVGASVGNMPGDRLVWPCQPHDPGSFHGDGGGERGRERSMGVVAAGTPSRLGAPSLAWVARASRLVTLYRSDHLLAPSMPPKPPSSMPPPRLQSHLLALLARARSPQRPLLFFHHNLPTHQSRSALFARLHILRSSAIPPAARTATWWYLKTSVKVFLAIHLLTSYIGTVGPTHGISMVPTIPHSYRSTPFILISRLHRHGRAIAVGDVVIYASPPNPSLVGCKRVIGMPGDFVSVLSPGRGDTDLDKEDAEGDWANIKGEVIRVPEGHCWLAGDNLEWSRDSRVFGAVPLNLVQGKALAVVWPPNAWKTLGASEGLRAPAQEEHDFVFAS